MALHRLLGMEVGVPEPGVLDAFYDEIGFVGREGAWGRVLCCMRHVPRGPLLPNIIRSACATPL